MNLETIVIIVSLAVLISLFVSANVIRKIIMIWRTPTTWISALPSRGRVEVIGKVEESATKSPIRQTPCALWQLEVMELFQSKNGSYWSTVYKRASNDVFTINDDTGKILIQPEGADIALEDDEIIEGPDAATRNKINDLGINTKDIWGKERKLQIFERLILSGEEVFAAGEVQQKGEQKSLIGNSSSPIFISEHSEHEILTSLYRRLTRNIGISLMVPVVIVVLFLLFSS